MRPKLFLIFALVAGGCSADWYRTSADRQVGGILHDREKTTLEYQPQVDVEPTVPAIPPKAAFNTIPLTTLTPKPLAHVEPEHIEVPYGPLGPEMKWPSGTTTAMVETFGLEAARTHAAQRLQLGPPSPWERPLRLDLFKSLGYGTQHSRSYKTQMEDLYLAALDVTLQRHLFEPTPFASTGVLYTGGQEDINYRSAYTITNEVGVKQQLPYGGEITARALVNFVNTINGNVNDGEQASVALSASIPLLRGAGMTNLEPLINSEREVVYEVRNFENFRRQFVVQVATQYFALLTQQQRVANREENLESLRGITDRTRALYAASLLASIDVQRALQSQLSAENDLIDAQANYGSALDDFKILLGIATEEPVEVVPQQLDVSVPNVDATEAVRLAHEYRLDLQTAHDRIEDAQRNVDVAKNGLLPDLDFTADGRLANDRRTTGDIVDTGPSYDLRNDTATYSAGVKLSLPLDRVAERNTYRRALILLERAQRSYDELHDNVAADARESVRRMESAQLSLEIQKNGIELARRRLENAEYLMRQGKRDNRDLVDAQQSLLSAQDQYESARANLQVQILRFLRDTGTLRVDPQAGSIGHALDRAAFSLNDGQLRR